MRFTDEEYILFDKVQEEFWQHYQVSIDEMVRIAAEKGKTRDKDTPMHHRMQPEDLNHELEKKSRRIRSALSSDWKDNVETMDKILEEARDIANFALFLAAEMLLFITDEMGPEVVEPRPDISPEDDEPKRQLRLTPRRAG